MDDGDAGSTLRVRALNLEPLRRRMEALAVAAGLLGPGPVLYALLGKVLLPAKIAVGCGGVFCIVTAVGTLIVVGRLRAIRTAHATFVDPRTLFACMAACGCALLSFVTVAAGTMLVPYFLPGWRATPGDAAFALIFGLVALWPAALIRECFLLWRRTTVEEHELPPADRPRLRAQRPQRNERRPDHTPVPYAPDVRFLDDASG